MFADRLKQLRESAGMTQPELAVKLGVSNGAIGNWESGGRTPRNAKLDEIADLFNVTIDYLMDRTESKPEFTLKELDMIRLYRKASPADKQVIQLLLSKYEVNQ